MSVSGANSTAAQSLESSESVETRHYMFLVFLMILNIMNFVDRQLLGSFANYIKPELGLTDGEWGLLNGLVFIIFYSAMGLFMGALADTLHRPRLVSAGVGLWSVLTAVSGAATNFVTLAIPRMFIGVGESVLTPTSMSMLSDRFPASRMGFASGFYYMGVPIGAGASMLIAGYLGDAIGWRNCFYLLGGIGIGFAVIMFFVRETPRRKVPGQSEEQVQLSVSGLVELAKTFWGAITTSPALLLTILGGIAVHFILGAAVFDQLWFVEEKGFERAYILQVTGWIGVFAGVAGNLFGGIGGDWFLKKTGMGRPMFLFWIMLLFLPFNIIYRLVPGDSLWFWIGVFLGWFQLGCFYGPTFSTVQELVPPSIRASIVAFYILTLNLVGLGIGITLAGYSIDWMRAAGVVEPYTWTLLVFTLLSATSIPLFYFAGRRFARDKERLYAAQS